MKSRFSCIFLIIFILGFFIQVIDASKSVNVNVIVVSANESSDLSSSGSNFALNNPGLINNENNSNVSFLERTINPESRRGFSELASTRANGFEYVIFLLAFIIVLIILYFMNRKVHKKHHIRVRK